MQTHVQKSENKVHMHEKPVSLVCVWTHLIHPVGGSSDPAVTEESWPDLEENELQEETRNQSR